jgi:hypothetical protein
MGRKKSAPQILPALVSSQACLAHRDMHTSEQIRFQLHPPLGMAPAHLRNCRSCQQLGVIEAALPLFGSVHRHRDHQHLRCNSNKSFQAIRQEHTQSAGHGLHSVVLE